MVKWQVVAVAARDLKHAQEFAQKHNIPRAYGSYEELAKDPEIGERLHTDLRTESVQKHHHHVCIKLPPSVLLLTSQKNIKECDF